MKPSFIQFNCRETKGLDLRQADAVKKYRPDIIILEYPNNNKTPNLPFNKYPALKKPKKLVDSRIAEFSDEVLKNNPWVKADTIMWNNITDLWKENHQVLVYSVDAPNELIKQWWEVWNHTYPCAKKNWLWWVRIYLREKYMAKNVQWVLDNYHGKNQPNILIFLESFHWDHVRFLLSKPSKNEEWNYYFGNFSEINVKDIESRIKKLNKVFYKHWKKVSVF